MLLAKHKFFTVTVFVLFTLLFMNGVAYGWCTNTWFSGEYTWLENILVLVIPYLFILIAYFLIRPVLYRKVSEKQRERVSSKSAVDNL